MSNDVTARKERLRAIPLFSRLDDASLDRAAAVMIEFEAPAGHVLIQTHEAGEGMFLIDHGTVVVTRGPDETVLGAGEVFGELALLDEGSLRTARVRAKSDVSGLCMRRDDFTSLLSTEPQISLALLRVLAHRLAEHIGH